MNNNITPTGNSAGQDQPISESETETPLPTANENNLRMLMDLPVGVRIRLAKTTISLGEGLRLGTGDLVPLDCSVEDPVEVLVGDRVLAKGEIVVVDGDYAVRIQQIMSHDDRLRTVQQVS